MKTTVVITTNNYVGDNGENFLKEIRLNNVEISEELADDYNKLSKNKLVTIHFEKE